VGPPLPQGRGFVAALFTPDGKAVVTGDGEGVIQRWDAETGGRLGAPLRHPSAVAALDVSPDGRTVVAGYQDGSARLWDVRTGKPAGPPAVLRTALRGVAFRPDGRTFLTTAVDQTTRVWPVPGPAVGGDDELGREIEILTGLRMDDTRQAVVPRGTDAAAAGPGEPAVNWHETAALDAEQEGAHRAVVFHLDRVTAARPDDWLGYARRARAFTSLGEFDRAAADYDRAADRGGAAHLADWYAHRAVELSAAEQWAAARWYLNRAIAARPADWLPYALRLDIHTRTGNVLGIEPDLERAVARGAPDDLVRRRGEDQAREGRWRAAADLFARAADGPADFDAGYLRAVSLLRAGDVSGYRELCAAALAVFPARARLGTVDDAAWLCALGPGAVPDWDRPLKLVAFLRAGITRMEAQARPAEKGEVLQLKHVVLVTCGAVLYRAGRYQEAIDVLQTRVEAKSRVRDPHARAFLAMAHHRLGNAAEAGTWLAKAADARPKGGSAWSWDDVETQLLIEEATALVRPDQSK
jgi:tetratricopeptide (TPR) repeat protein